MITKSGLLEFPNPCLLHICGGWSSPLYCIKVKPYFDECRKYRERFFRGLPSPDRQLSLDL